MTPLISHRRLRRTARHAVATVAAITTLILAPGVAHADSWTHTDPARDVVAFDDEGAETPAPEVERGDIRRVRITHSSTRVRIRYTMRETFGANHGLVHAIRTPRNQFWLVRFRADGLRHNGLFLDQGEKEIRCRGIDWSIDRARATVIVSVPRSCLGRPRWVRAGVGVQSVGADAAHVDDGLRVGTGSALRLSPRLYRA
ncbi:MULTISPECIES: hypothetical protein [Nocardioides]|uniref:DUF1850 domain-containing protein n=1 Tax=Nocardioides vastitatis TaxID=2568655 RepID=A0ABW0ZLQ2_9ACTN|nr:hypothetical protein [Nocardioides sp.]THI94373.1 hypothetical protein E7Z54_20035 [Nocardioides sp.]